MTGKGAIPCIDPLSAGLFGRYDRIANRLIDESDLLVVIGCKLGEIATRRFTVPAPEKGSSISTSWPRSSDARSSRNCAVGRRVTRN